MDYLSLRTAVADAAPRLTGKRVSGIAQPAKGEILIGFRGKIHLLLSIRPERPGLFFPPKDMAAKGPTGSFSRLLAARIKGAVPVSISLPERGERMVRMEFSPGWPEKQGETLTMVLEVMGRHSNLILLDSGGGITGSLKPVPAEKSRIRPIIPGHRWTPPPARTGIAIEDISDETLGGEALPGARELMDLVRGLSPVTARLAISRAAKGDTGKLADVLRKMSVQSTGESGCLALQGGRWNLFPFRIEEEEAESIRTFPSFPEAAWEWKVTAGPDEEQPDVTPLEDPDGRLKNEAERIRRSMAILEDEEDRCRQYGKSRLKAESILINLRQIPRGASRIILPCPSRENSSMEVRLDPSISALANAERLFSEAKRLKRGLGALRRKRAGMESFLGEIEKARQALSDGNMEPAEILLKKIRPPDTADGSPHRKTGRGRFGNLPGRRYWKDGFTILVGKSAADNERVTFEAASPGDLWLHARDYPGSHVVILTGGKSPPDEVIMEAGRLAAAGSGARQDSAVEIMVTERKWVHKVRGKKRGRVTVERFRSIRVKPKA